MLRQEVDRFNRLLSTIHTTLASLRLAVMGEIVMSEQLEEMYKAILSQKVPKSWQVGALLGVLLLRLLALIWRWGVKPSFKVYSTY